MTHLLSRRVYMYYVYTRTRISPEKTRPLPENAIFEPKLNVRMAHTQICTLRTVRYSDVYTRESHPISFDKP